MSAPTLVPSQRTCGVRYQEGRGGPAVAICTCGTFAIGRCTECGAPVCGLPDCSRMRAQKRVCTRHVIEAAKAAAEAAEAAQRLSDARAAEEARRQAIIDNTPLELSSEEAFDILFVSRHVTVQEVNSARQTLTGTDPADFTLLALERLRQAEEPSELRLWAGSTRSSVGRAIAHLRTVKVWWFSEYVGLATSGRWVYHSDPDGWKPGGQGYKRFATESLAQLLGPPRRRATGARVLAE